MEARWRAFALAAMLIGVATENVTGLTWCMSGLLLGIYYSARVDIVVRVRVGIKQSLSFGRPWTGGLEGGSSSAL